MSHAFEVIGFGVFDAAVLALAAVAFSLQFGVTNYFNFGYGEWLTFGAYAAFTVNHQLLGLNFWLAMFVAGIATAALSFGINRFVFSPFVKRRPEGLYILIVTFATGFILNEAIITIWGTPFHQFATGTPVVHRLGPLQLTNEQIAFFGITLGCMLLLTLLLRYTRLGRSMRAIADNRRLAVVCGLRTDLITDATWLITGFLAGVAGVILAKGTETFSTDLGDNYVYLIFPAVIIGGIGRVYGAVVGALIIGLFTAVGVLVIPAEVSPLIVFAALVAIILLRPQGLLGMVSRGHLSDIE